MKILKFLLPVLILWLFSGCTDKKIMPDKDALIHFRFNNMVGGLNLSVNNIYYRNAAGNNYKVELLKYYISNITLTNDKGVSVNLKNYNLLDASNLSSLNFTPEFKIANGKYRNIVFYVGVDKERNHTGAQEGALNPANGMLWSWNFGYIFFKMEGYFTSSTVPSPAAYRQHLGTDEGLTAVSLPVTLDVNGADKTVFIAFDIDKLLSAVHTIDFTGDSNRQSNPGDEVWMKNISDNLSHSFSVTRVE